MAWAMVSRWEMGDGSNVNNYSRRGRGTNTVTAVHTETTPEVLRAEETVLKTTYPLHPANIPATSLLARLFNHQDQGLSLDKPCGLGANKGSQTLGKGDRDPAGLQQLTVTVVSAPLTNVSMTMNLVCLRLQEVTVARDKPAISVLERERERKKKKLPTRSFHGISKV